ncbi:LysR family transcriptional regulator [Azorhizobium sp. AG788]|uniref:LysR substrate-binding domain-containing protein n=1 Tax=Azorhizobium sp. AG788 TaxID=2183897 RepID=UPI00105C10CD|nr:LysR substrate-binding domain-containing protein [Azorhizobium sp. AG788]TDT94947.1 LysR family transcriptional regulator [Azorhizobium sp. AG788]
MSFQGWQGAEQIELRHLRYFLATAEELNYRRAAERLRIAQPGLSQQIKKLEEIVGTPLFDRTRRTVRLTLAGELFMHEARKTLAHAESAMLVARRAGRGEVGRIAIGYVGSAAYTGVLTTMVGKFRSSYPEVELQISEMEMQQQLDQLDQGRLDIGFIRPPVPLPVGIGTIPVLFEDIVLALPEAHPQGASEQVALASLNEDIFITPHHPPEVSFLKHTTSACRMAGFFPRLGPQGRDFVTIASMVAVGLGVALVPQSVRCIQVPGLQYRPIADAKVLAELAVAFRRSEPSPVARAFAAHARRSAFSGAEPSPVRGRSKKS